MDSLALVVSEVLLLPYIAWGIRLLIRKYRYHEDEPILLEAITLVCVLAFCVLQVFLLRTYLRDDFVSLIFAVLGLMVSVAALYGHVIISLASRGIVDMMAPDPHDAKDVPRLGPAESLERCEDFEGALQECLVLARIYPLDPTVQMHIAENMRRLSRFEESAVWFEKASRNSTNHDSRLHLSIRAVEVLQQDLQRTGDAVQVLERYLVNTPDTQYEISVREHIERLLTPHREPGETETGLESLYETPLDDAEEMMMPAMLPSFAHLDEPKLTLEDATEQGSDFRGPLMALESFEPLPAKEEHLPREPNGLTLGLEAMDDLPTALPLSPRRSSGIPRKRE